MTCDRELIVGYLYDELTPAERQQLDRHLASCDSCRAEVAGLRDTRTALSAWAPPEPDLGFEVVQRPAVAAQPRGSFRVAPAWGLAAAAVLLLAVASAVANLEVQIGGDGFVVRTGWNRAGAVAPAVESAAITTPAGVPDPDVAALRARLDQLESALVSRSPAVSIPAGSTTTVVPAEMLRRVRQMIAESEQRQQGEMAVRIGQVHRDVEAARRADFARLQQEVAQVQGLNDAQVLRWQQVEDRLLRVVQQQR
jgi:hypothetical protein